MKNHIKRNLVTWTFCLVTGLALIGESTSYSAEDTGNKKLSLKEKRILAESSGHYFHQRLKLSSLDMDIESVIQGINDAHTGKYPPLESDDYFKTQLDYLDSVREDLMAEKLKNAEDFLAKNKDRPSVVSLEDGQIQYEIINEGAGGVVPENGNPLVHFEGKLLDGYVFDTTKGSGKPITILLEKIIAGLGIGVKGMKEGEVRRIYIHPDFGFMGMQMINSSSLIIYDVEVVEAEPVVEAESVEEK